MAVTVISGWETDLALTESHLVMKNAWLCFRISSSSLGNNPSLQIRSFSDDQGTCNKTGDLSIGNFSTVLTSHMQSLADSSHLPSDETYRLYLSLLCYRLSTPCYECKPNTRHFFGKLFIKKWCWWEKLCLSCWMPSIGSLQFMFYCISSNICDFHFPVDFRLNDLFPHIFSFLHQN